MLVIDVYKNGEFTRYKDISTVILQKSGILEIFVNDGSVIIFQDEEYDWFNVLLK